MDQRIPYKSFCWSLGTTSFRTRNFNKTIEEQLDLLREFREREENRGQSWSGNHLLQSRYYDYMKEKGFVEGDAGNKPKDAREKTSGLVDLGLIDQERTLTPAGRALWDICRAGDFSRNNFFRIPADSYLYLKQLLKTASPVGEEVVRPFVVLLYLLVRLESLSTEEFRYLLPLCTSRENTEQILEGIRESRSGKTTADTIILKRLMGQSNYQQALKLFLENPVNEELLCQVGMNRKSRGYDKAYYPLYSSLRAGFLEGKTTAFAQALQDLEKIKIGRWWKGYLFDTSSPAALKKAPQEHLKQTAFQAAVTEEQFKTAFFQVMHLLKAKATLWDYFDLNRRYIRTADIVLFEDGEVKLDLLPRYFFEPVMEQLYSCAYSETRLLGVDCPMEQIHPALAVDGPAVLKALSRGVGENLTSFAQVEGLLEARRYARLEQLVDKKFSRKQLAQLLDLFQQRKDKEIQEQVTDNADIPTIFEYVLGIIWYRISGRKGKILDYMKLSLDGNLLPKTHAGGGEADIVYEYAATPAYPAHTLLLEATLAEKTNQRRMEMEPVSRHLGRHLLQTGNKDSYCVFATNYLDINVISDFRSRKYTPYYDPQDSSRSVPGMMIIPLETTELKKMVLEERTYEELYSLFHQAYQSQLPPHQWYGSCIQDML